MTLKINIHVQPKIGSQPDSGSNEDEEGMDTEKIPVLIKIPSAFEAGK